MMSTRSNVEIGTPVTGLDVNRGYQGDIWEMSSSAKRIVEHDHISRGEWASCNGGLHRHRHRPQMHRHVVAHGDHMAVGVKHSAGVIPALFYVGRECRAAQGRAHFFGDRMKNVLEDFQFDRVTPRHRFSVARANSLTTEGTELHRGNPSLFQGGVMRLAKLCLRLSAYLR